MEIVGDQAVFLPATPSQYLHRLQLQNSLFGDAIRLLGVQATGHDLRIVTDQPHIVGRAPDWDEMETLLIQQHGLRRLAVPPMGYYKSRAYLSRQIGIFDVHPANCVVATAAVLVPIDFIMVQFDARSLAVLEQNLR